MPPRSLPQPLQSGVIPGHLRGSYVYRIYDGRDRLLYVGVTDGLCQRITEHRRTRSRWTYEAERIEWDLYPSRDVAETVEQRTIIAEYPMHNTQHNGRRHLAESFGHSRLYDSAAWVRLGALVRARREELRRTQTSLAGDAGVPVAGWRDLERGEPERYERSFLDGVERALRWQPGAMEAVLAGAEPAVLSDVEVGRQAAARARVIVDAQAGRW